jgi:hypothetical protein
MLLYLCTCEMQMNITSRAQYISTTSAGAWVTIPYAYTSAPLSRFFSPYYEPNNLTTARLSTTLTPGSWGMYSAGKTLLNGALGNPGAPVAATLCGT